MALAGKTALVTGAATGIGSALANALSSNGAHVIGADLTWSNLEAVDHVKFLERLLRSPKFARETARLRRGVVMFHSDLVYLRENVKARKEILEVERRSHRRRPLKRTPRR
jgi:NAD(P)-dependent dehydrogenase (short-subunit alcohol dehydrogenase family)